MFEQKEDVLLVVGPFSVLVENVFMDLYSVRLFNQNTFVMGDPVIGATNAAELSTMYCTWAGWVYNNLLGRGASWQN